MYFFLQEFVRPLQFGRTTVRKNSEYFLCLSNIPTLSVNSFVSLNSDSPSSNKMRRNFLLVTRYFLLITRYFLHVTHYFLFVTRYFLFVTRCFLLFTRYFLLVDVDLIVLRVDFQIVTKSKIVEM